MTTVGNIRETHLYVANVERAACFYVDVMGLRPIAGDGKWLAVFEIAPDQVLILFRRGSSLDPIGAREDSILPSDGSTPVRSAFEEAEADIPAWLDHFTTRGVPVENDIAWGSSVGRPGTRSHSSTL